MAIFPLLATVISGVFAVTLGLQYATKRRPYLLAWCVALTIYALATLTETLGAALTWSPWLYRGYYFLAAIALVGVLALGTILLLAPRLAPAAIIVLAVLTVVGLVGVLGARLETGDLDTRQVPRALPLAGGRFNVLAAFTAILINISGTLILVGGALWSALAARWLGHPRERIVANLLIAAGALIVAGATGLSRLGVYELFYVGQAAGALVMFIGFLVAQRRRTPARELTPVT